MELELKDYFNIIKKRIWIIVAMVLVASITTAIISYYFIQPIYAANTKLIVNKSSEFQGLDKLDLNSVNVNIRLINTYKEIIKTPAILDKVISKHPEFNMSTDQLTSQINVSSTNDTQVMTISVQDPSHERAVNMVNAVAAVFKEEIPTIMKVDNIAILNEAKIASNPSPIKPNPKLNIIIAVVVSLMISIGFIFLLEYLDDSIKSEKDIELYLGVPTLAVIMKMKKSDIKSGEAVLKRKVGETVYANLKQ